MTTEILDLIITYKYLALFVIAFIEGPFASLGAGYLTYIGQLQILPTFITLLLADFIPDIVYYLIGRYGNETKLVERYRKKKGFIANNLKLIEHLWKNHPRKTMFFGKLAYGLSTPIIISAGLTKIPIKQYISYTIPVTLFQITFLTILGYLLGHSYELAEKYVKLGYELIAVAMIVAIIIYVVFSKYARKQIEKMESEEDLKDTIDKSN